VKSVEGAFVKRFKIEKNETRSNVVQRFVNILTKGQELVMAKPKTVSKSRICIKAMISIKKLINIHAPALRLGKSTNSLAPMHQD